MSVWESAVKGHLLDFFQERDCPFKWGLSDSLAKWGSRLMDTCLAVLVWIDFNGDATKGKLVIQKPQS